MRDVVVIGAGKIGAFVAGLLASTGDYQVTLVDRSAEVLGSLDRDERIRIVAADVEESLKLVDLRPFSSAANTWSAMQASSKALDIAAIVSGPKAALSAKYWRIGISTSGVIRKARRYSERCSTMGIQMAI